MGIRSIRLSSPVGQTRSSGQVRSIKSSCDSDFYISSDWATQLQLVMSIEEKQEYLRETILQSGISTEVFFEYWQTLELELDEVNIEKLRQVVETFLLSNKPQQQQHQDNMEAEVMKQTMEEEQQDEFTDFQEAEFKEVKNEYPDFNWDFLKTKKHHQQHLLQDQSVQESPAKIALPVPQQPVEIKVQKVEPVAPKPSEIEKIVKIESKSVAKKPEPPKKVEQVEKKAQINSNLIDQVNESPPPKRSRQLPTENINVKQQKSVTVKEVLQSSKMGRLKCLKLQENVLSHHLNVEIFITNVEEVEEKSSNIINKLMKNTALAFTIKTIARNKNRSVGVSWEVKRKPSEFEWLRNSLIKFYPGLVVPPLPAQTKSKEKIFGYQKKLEHFLLDCYRCPQLKNSKYYEVFLSYSNPSDFEAFVKKSATASKPKELNHIINMTGSIDTLFSDNIQQYGLGLQSYLTKTSNHLKQVNHILGEINQTYGTISELYKDLANVFVQMSDESHSFSNQKCYQRLTNTYKQIAYLVDQHSNFCQNQKDFIDAFMMGHFSYEKLRLENMQGLITKRTTFATQLSKRSKDQDSKGVFGKLTSIFGEKAESVDIPSSNYETLSNQVGYYNNQLLQESVRCIEVMIQSHINHFSGYGHSRIDNVDKMQKIWSNILVQLSRLNLVK